MPLFKGRCWKMLIFFFTWYNINRMRCACVCLFVYSIVGTKREPFQNSGTRQATRASEEVFSVVYFLLCSLVLECDRFYSSFE